MSKRTNVIIVGVIITVLILAGSIYLRKNGSKKVEIKMSDQQAASSVVSQPGADVQQGSDMSASSEEKTTATKGLGGADSVSGKTEAKNDIIKIVDRLVSFGFRSATNRSIDSIIIHSTYDAVGSDPFSVSGVIEEYRSYGVSPHYLIGRDGTIYRLVKDKDIAYHAGVAQTPDGRTNVNEFSIGIELINTKTDKFTDAQYASLNNLIDQLKREYKVKYVLGHDQIAPGRKDDPWNFDWKRLK